MKTESKLFLLPGVFFVVISFIYGWLTDFNELVGFPAILLTGGLALMIGIYFNMLAKRHGQRAEDNPEGEIAELSGEQGVYAPWSWWPLAIAIAAGIGFFALAAGFWLLIPAAVLGVIGLVGWVFEFSTGQHAH